jgi:hypothetical protein
MSNVASLIDHPAVIIEGMDGGVCLKEIGRLANP